MKKPYTVLKTFAHDNMRCEAGVVVELSDKQATFLLAGEFIAPAAQPAAEEPAAATKKTKAEA